MNKVLVDTNVLLRYLLDDDENMGLTAELVLAGGAWTTPEVLAEVVYVLSSIYDRPRDDIHAALCMIQNEVELRPAITERAIQEYGDTNLDFVDCMMVAHAIEGDERFFTFDKGINKRISDIRKSS